MLEQSIHEFHRVLHDVCGTNFMVAKHFLPLIKDVENSTFTIITGISGEKPVQPGTGLLTVGESALYGLFTCIKEEFKDKKVRINEYRVGLQVRPLEKLEPDNELMVSNLDLARDLITRVIKNTSVRGNTIEARTKDDLKLGP